MEFDRQAMGRFVHGARVFLVAVLCAAVTCLGPQSAASAAGGSDVASDVLVATDRTEYREGEELTVTVTNRLPFPIFGTDQKAFCSAFDLDRCERDGWRTVGRCAAGAPPRRVRFAPHSSTSTTLPGPAAGSYRIALAFTVGSQPWVGDRHVSYSAAFVVR